MTSQPLETIPEAPTPAPTPARVTADPPKTKPAKNPGRVASGKRLAERNRLGREALARETLKAEAEAKAAEPTPTKTEDSASDSSSPLSRGYAWNWQPDCWCCGLVLPARVNHGQAKSCTSTAGTNASTGTVSHSGETRPKENGISFENTIYTFTMEDFARGTVVGFAVSMTIPAMYYFNKAALGTLFSINMKIGKALLRLIVRPPPPEIEYVPMKHTCNDDDCTIVCCFCDSDHYSCYDCTKEKLKP